MLLRGYFTGQQPTTDLGSGYFLQMEKSHHEHVWVILHLKREWRNNLKERNYELVHVHKHIHTHSNTLSLSLTHTHRRQQFSNSPSGRYHRAQAKLLILMSLHWMFIALVCWLLVPVKRLVSETVFSSTLFHYSTENLLLREKLHLLTLTSIQTHLTYLLLQQTQIHQHTMKVILIFHPTRRKTYLT